MITSGLVLTLSANHQLAEQAEQSLRLRPELMLGECSQRWLPVVAEAQDVRSSREMHDWLSGLPGVEFVDVVHVSFDEPGDSNNTQEIQNENRSTPIRKTFCHGGGHDCGGYSRPGSQPG